MAIRNSKVARTIVGLHIDNLYELEGTLYYAITFLETLRTKYGKDATLYFSGDGTFTVRYERLETPKEVKIRIAAHKEKKARTNEKKERKLLEKLKAKYEREVLI
jgi:hypothetical protein